MVIVFDTLSEETVKLAEYLRILIGQFNLFLKYFYLILFRFARR